MVTALRPDRGAPGRRHRQPALVPRRRDRRRRRRRRPLKFVRICNSFGLPLVVLVDTPGFLPGTKQEGLGVIRHGRQAAARVRGGRRAEGDGRAPKGLRRRIHHMNSKDLGADLALAWPDAEIGIMGPKQAVAIVNRRAHRGGRRSRGRARPAGRRVRRRARDGRGGGRGGLHRRADRAADTRRRLAGALAALSGAGRVRQRLEGTSRYDASTSPWATASRPDSMPGEPRWPDVVARELGPGHALREPRRGWEPRASTSSASS